ncbi:BolA family protein [Teredinibacter waterburyi]|jgi:Predicted transcriptional regulator, BolA superfamily|uniref:BolA family protein n=1 Tax=Teredinibacter waterburyi TaxID=1500538 RepID=UPI00165F950C|nr:BolA/IbaG family iron-sulfur metabolism protein [Teredinibacter waterburyi]
MQPHEIKAALEAAIADSEVDAATEGNHAHVTVVSPVFEGLSPVKKQQLVYGALREAIASGVIHAVHMKTYTPAEWAALQN